MEKLVIIPAAGRSSRFKGSKPKWLRTHPDGKLMINHSLSTFHGLNVKIVLITTKEIDKDFNVTDIIKNACPSIEKIILLDRKTKSAVETVYLGLKKYLDKNKFEGGVFVKDSDNYVKADFTDFDYENNYTVGCNVRDFNITKLTNKSFLQINDLGSVIGFVEKKIISEIISVGSHYFSSVKNLEDNLKEMMEIDSGEGNEMYMSHLISHMIFKNINFKVIYTYDYQDFGTQIDWDLVQKNNKAIFCDFDGTLVKNKGRYEKNNWFNREDIPLINNLKKIKKEFDKGAQIIITTSRIGSEKDYIVSFLAEYGIKVFNVITDLNHSPRYLINDFAETNPYPSARSINIPRNGDMDEYL